MWRFAEVLLATRNAFNKQLMNIALCVSGGLLLQRLKGVEGTQPCSGCLQAKKDWGGNGITHCGHGAVFEVRMRVTAHCLAVGHNVPAQIVSPAVSLLSRIVAVLIWHCWQRPDGSWKGVGWHISMHWEAFKGTFPSALEVVEVTCLYQGLSTAGLSSGLGLEQFLVGGGPLG